MSKKLSQLPALTNLTGAEYTIVEHNGDNYRVLLSKLGVGDGPVSEVTKETLGLNLVDNTPDAQKPISGPTQAALNTKASSTHNHAISGVVGLQEQLNDKAAAAHIHVVSNVTGLQGELDGKAAAQHGHSIAHVEDLQNQLNGKASTGHGHAVTDVTGLQNQLDAKATAQHGHSIANIGDLQNQLNNKADAGHVHTVANVTGLSTQLQALSDQITNSQGVAIDDNAVVTGKTWSSQKIASVIPDVSRFSLVENKTSAMIRGELTAENVATALGGSPVQTVTLPISNATNVVAQAVGLKFLGPNVNVTAPNNGAVGVTVTVSNPTKSDLGLGNVNDTPDAAKPVSAPQAAAIAEALAAAIAHADNNVIGLWEDRGTYNASSNTFPATGGSGPGGAILKGDIWTISVPGTLGGEPVVLRQTVRAIEDAPGQTASKWALETANTTLTQTITSGAVGVAPSSDAVFNGLATKVNTSSLGSGVLATLLNGISFGTNAVITATDSVLSALGKLQKQFTDFIATAVTKSGAETLSNKTLTTPTINGFTEASYYPPAASTFTVDLANGTLQKLRITANATITVPAPVVGKSYTIIIAYMGAYTVTFIGAGGSVLKPAGGSMPTATSVSGKTDAYVFIVDPDGTQTIIQDGWRGT